MNKKEKRIKKKREREMNRDLEGNARLVYGGSDGIRIPRQIADLPSDRSAKNDDLLKPETESFLIV